MALRPLGLRLGALLLAVALLAGGCDGEETRPVVLGVGSTTEQQVLAALTVAALDEAGLTVEMRSDLGGTIRLRREALRGGIDVFWDYTGAAWALGMGEQAPPDDPGESFERVQRADEDRGLVWLGPTEANATLALFVRRNELPESGGMTWLAGVLSSGEARLCADPDFVERPGGLDVLAEAYAIGRERLRVEPADEEQAVAEVAAGRCFAGLATATSGLARSEGLAPVADDLQVFPAFVLAPVVREEALARHPEVEAALEPVIELLDTATLAELNAEVLEGADPEQLAGAALEAAG